MVDAIALYYSDVFCMMKTSQFFTFFEVEKAELTTEDELQLYEEYPYLKDDKCTKLMKKALESSTPIPDTWLRALGNGVEGEVLPSLDDAPGRAAEKVPTIEEMQGALSVPVHPKRAKQEKETSGFGFSSPKRAKTKGRFGGTNSSSSSSSSSSSKSPRRKSTFAKSQRKKNKGKGKENMSIE